MIMSFERWLNIVPKRHNCQVTIKTKTFEDVTFKKTGSKYVARNAKNTCKLETDNIQQVIHFHGVVKGA